MNHKPRVLFMCVHNSCRSQMAEAIGKMLASDRIDFASAGTEVKERINPDAVRLIKEIYGVDMEETQRPKLYSDSMNPDYLISMGCGVVCPTASRAYDEDWGLPDPTGKSDDEFRNVIANIEIRVQDLVDRLETKLWDD